MDEQPPRFFNWVEEDWQEPEAVPLRVRTYMRIMWLHGARTQDLARTFKVPVSWVDEFVVDRTLDGDTKVTH